VDKYNQTADNAMVDTARMTDSDEQASASHYSNNPSSASAPATVLSNLASDGKEVDSDDDDSQLGSTEWWQGNAQSRDESSGDSKSNGRSLGWGQAEYNDDNARKFDHLTIVNFMHRQTGNDEEERTVHVANLNYQVQMLGIRIQSHSTALQTTEQQLFNLFSNYKPIEARIPTNYDGRSRGFGFDCPD